MRIFFDAGILSERGTTVALYDYARFAQGLLNADVIIGYCGVDDRNAGVLQNFQDQFTCIRYTDEDTLKTSVLKERAEFFYQLTSGRAEATRIADVWIANHIVFQHDHALPDTCAYVSEWLSHHATGGRRPFVPHIVDMPQPQENPRAALSIPHDAFVVGRHGGYTTFDIPFLPRAIERALATRQDLWFLFLNTEPFLEHKRIIYLPSTSDAQKKADFIGACDVMLHGRRQGETFGLSMAEFQHLGKPALCWRGGTDQNHLSMQTDASLIYWTAQDLLKKLVTLRHETLPHIAPEIRERFNPKNVMDKFQKTFLTINRDNDKASLQGRGQLATPSLTRIGRKTRKEWARNIDRLCENYSKLF